MDIPGEGSAPTTYWRPPTAPQRAQTPPTPKGAWGISRGPERRSAAATRTCAPDPPGTAREEVRLPQTRPAPVPDAAPKPTTPEPGTPSGSMAPTMPTLIVQFSAHYAGRMTQKFSAHNGSSYKPKCYQSVYSNDAKVQKPLQNVELRRFELLTSSHGTAHFVVCQRLVLA